jgi:hypothetical protein
LALVSVAVLSCWPLARADSTVFPADRQEIEDLISSYSRTFDSRELDAFVALFSPDATVEFYPAGATVPLVSESGKLVWQVGLEPPATVMTGVYVDVFTKIDGQWKIARRTLLMDQRELPK